MILIEQEVADKDNINMMEMILICRLGVIGMIMMGIIIQKNNHNNNKAHRNINHHNKDIKVNKDSMKVYQIALIKYNLIEAYFR